MSSSSSSSSFLLFKGLLEGGIPPGMECIYVLAKYIYIGLKERRKKQQHRAYIFPIIFVIRRYCNSPYFFRMPTLF